MTGDRRGGGLSAAAPLLMVLTLLLGIGGIAVVVERGMALPGQRVEQTFVAPPPPPPPLDAAAIAAATAPVLVNISATGDGPTAHGTGIVLTPDGEVLTSHHVIKGARDVRAVAVGAGAEFDADVLGYDTSKDIALLRLRAASGLAAAKLGPAVRIGEELLAAGNAGGAGGAPTTVTGFVRELDASIVARNDADFSRNVLRGLIAVEAPVSHGHSGGPMVNSRAEVVAMTAAATLPEGDAAPASRGYAIPIEAAMAVVAQIRSGRGTDTVHVGPTANLGVIASDGDGAVRVEVVMYGTPAYRAGMRAKDVLAVLDGQRVESVKALRALLSGKRPGDVVRVQWTDAAGAAQSAEVTLAEGTP